MFTSLVCKKLCKKKKPYSHMYLLLMTILNLFLSSSVTNAGTDDDDVVAMPVHTIINTSLN